MTQLADVGALAILLVLMTHLWTYPAGHELLNRIARVGWAGVDLFFVLSGYLITFVLLREYERHPQPEGQRGCSGHAPGGCSLSVHRGSSARAGDRDRK